MRIEIEIIRWGLVFGAGYEPKSSTWIFCVGPFLVTFARRVP